MVPHTRFVFLLLVGGLHSPILGSLPCSRSLLASHGCGSPNLLPRTKTVAFPKLALKLRGGDSKDSKSRSEAPERRYFKHITEDDSDDVTMKDQEGGDQEELQMRATPTDEELGFETGGVLAWGINVHGRLGDGGWVDGFRPKRNKLAKDVVAVSAGDYHSLALCSNGSVFAWGSNGHGQLGDTTTQNRNAPRLVHGLDSHMLKVEAGGLHSMALAADGMVVVWGDNSSGQLARTDNPWEDEHELRRDGHALEVYIPVSVRGLTAGVRDIAAGFQHSFALMQDGRLLAWGNNIYGQLGIGKNITLEIDEISQDMDVQYCAENIPMRVKVPRAAGAVQEVAAGGFHSLALMEGGGVLAWGNNHFGQLGNGRFTDLATSAVGWRDELEPAQTLVGREVVRVSAGFWHSLALLHNGSVLAWGSNTAGQLGCPNSDPTLKQHSHSRIHFRTRPALVHGLGGRAVDISAAFSHSMVLLEDGRVVTFGGNYDGQLGHGYVIGDKILYPKGTIRGDWVPRHVPGFQNAGGGMMVSAGSSHSLVIVRPDLHRSWPDFPPAGTEEDWLYLEASEIPPWKARAGPVDGSLEFETSAIERRTVNVTAAMQQRAGCDLGPHEMHLTGPEALFTTWRPKFTDRGEQWMEILPTMVPVQRRDPVLPRLRYTEWIWRNISEDDAVDADMPWPQQYRDGYGCSAPAPDILQALLNASRRAYLEHGGDGIQPASNEEKALSKTLQGLIADAEREHCLRAARFAVEDSEKCLASKDFDTARVWARKACVAFRDAGESSQGKAERDRLMARAEEEEGQWNEEEEARELQRREDEHPLCMRWNETSMDWELPYYMDDPIPREELCDLGWGEMVVALPVGETVKDLRARLKAMLQEEEVWIYYMGQPMEDTDERIIAEWCAKREDTVEEDEPLEILTAGWPEYSLSLQRQQHRPKDAPTPDPRKLRIENLFPTYGAQGGESVIAVHGYGFDNGSTWELQFGEEGDVTASGEPSPVRQPALVHSDRVLGCWCPPHVIANVSVRLFRDGEEVWAQDGAFEYIDPFYTSILCQPLRLRHLGTPKQRKGAEVMEQHAKCCQAHIDWVARFGFLNDTQEATEAADKLHHEYQRLLYLDPDNERTLHNFGVFLEDIRQDRPAAQRLYDRGGLDMVEVVRVKKDESKDLDLVLVENERELAREYLHLLPEDERTKGEIAPDKVAWPWQDEEAGEPKGRYESAHLCSDPTCKLPRLVDPVRDVIRARGCFGIPLPQLPGETESETDSDEEEEGEGGREEGEGGEGTTSSV